MGRDTGIAWCDHTFNIAWGCQKVSPACTNCYAETLDARFGGGHWGPGSTRKTFGAKHWNEPIRWDRTAAKLDVRMRVFSSSMADVFEDHPDLVPARAKLWELIARTPNLDWLLLTKRPENIERFTPDSMRGAANVWLGATAENQEYADLRVPLLLRNPAVVHFLSCEPLLGPIDLTRIASLGERTPSALEAAVDVGVDRDAVSWVIAGCESGPGARAQVLDWYRGLRDQCRVAGVPFFLKQLKRDVGSSQPDRTRLPIVVAGDHSWTKAGDLIEQPYLDGEQYVEFPTPTPRRA